MKINEVKQFCISLSSADSVEKKSSKNYLAYTVYGKKFAYFKISDPEKWRFTFRVTLERFLELTDQEGV